MRIFSWKTFWVSVLAIAFAFVLIWKSDDLGDFFWIFLLGFWAFKGFQTAFSQSAYENDLKKTQNTRRLYCDLFGNFAFIAADIPMLMFFFIVCLLVTFPVTAYLRYTILACLLFAAVYSLWFLWYISRHKREKAAYRNLSEAEEKKWKWYDRWHVLKACILILLIGFLFLFGYPYIYLNNRKLNTALSELTCKKITLEEAVPFKWTTVYSFAPYTPLEVIQRVTGSKSPALQESVNEGMNSLVFKDIYGQVAASVCAYPSNLGYSISFTQNHSYEGYFYSYIEYGDFVEFEVTLEEDYIMLSEN